MIADLKPYPAMKDSGIPWLGEVPERWSLLPNKVMLRRRKTLVGERHTDYQLLSLTKMGVIVRDVSTNRGKFSADMGTFQEVRCGDLVFCLFDVPETPRTIGLSQHKGMITGAYDVFECDDHLLARYLEAFYIAMDDRKLLSPLYLGLRNTIPISKFLGVKTPVPPLPEQAAIVRFLDHADRRIRRYIRAQQQLIALLEEQRQAIIHQAVTGQINVRTGKPYQAYKPSGVEWLGDVPEHWEIGRLKVKLRPIDCRSSSGTETLLSLRRDLGVVVYAEHFSRPPQGASLVGYKLVETGQLVVNRLQANNGLLFCSRLSGVVSPDYSVFTARSPVDMEYLGSLLRTITYKAHFRRESTGLGTGSAGFLRLYDDRLLETPVALPPLEDQRTLLVSLNEVTAFLCRAIERQHVGVTLLREYRTRLIADVVTGKFDVREAAARLPDEVEELQPLDEADALIDGEEEPSDDLDAVPEEAEM